MGKTLEETREYIIEFSKQHGLRASSMLMLLHEVDIDENGLICEYDLQSLYNTLVSAANARTDTERRIEHIKEDRKKRKGAN